MAIDEILQGEGVEDYEPHVAAQLVELAHRTCLTDVVLLYNDPNWVSILFFKTHLPCEIRVLHLQVMHGMC